jgi:integrase
VAQRTFTDSYIRNLKAKAQPYKRAESAPKGEGRLIVRVLPSGVKEFFYRYRPSGEDKTVSLGRYDSAGHNGLTLAGVRERAHEIRALQRSTGDVKEHLRAEERQREIEARQGSFRQLLAAYVKSLRDAKKASADEVEALFRRNVTEPFKVLADARASEVEPGDIQRILARLVRQGIKRQVNVTRSYLRAAFAYGTKADHDPRTVAEEGVLFGLKYNPASTVPRIKEFEQVGDRTLTENELRAFWLGLEKQALVQRQTLRFNLAIGCQRPKQLLRADWSAFDFDKNTLLLRDTKGRGGSRDHLLPLTSFALEQLKPLRDLNGAAGKDGKTPPPFSSDGKRPMVLTTLSVAVREVSDTLKKSDNIPRFQQRDLRRTVETMLQKLGIDKEVRAHLLSHGRTRGVQGQHYERYDFLEEKRRALRKWAAYLERIIERKPAAKVTPIRAA